MSQDFQGADIHTVIELQRLGNDERKADRELVFREAELSLKREDLAARRDELALKAREVILKEKEQKYSRWLNPVFLGLIAATATLLGNIVVTREQAKVSLEQERTRNRNALDQARLKAQSDLILEAIKTGDPAKAATNLGFFAKLGFIDDPQGKIQSYLANSDRNNVPVLPPSSGSPSSNTNIFKPIDTLKEGAPERMMGRSVGRLDLITSEHIASFCTAWVISRALIITADYCVADAQAIAFTTDFVASGRASKTYDVDSVPVEIDHAAGFALLRLRSADANTLEPLRLGARDPKIGEPIFLIHHPAGGPQTLSEDANDCKVITFPTDSAGEFEHTCATAAGSSGAPIISLRDLRVIGLHHGKSGMNMVNRGQLIARILQTSRMLDRKLLNLR